ncbi:hypothetical protein [Mariniradius sediminis]|uniref:HEXXH motif-containing protein n=1 Tax=Mariniradius sediminis TaxID=2909237 RepID=A0ABS9BWF1_9BACT|nr:hypothetical protein [Mariniradius sediminis]MCF1752343.1 hypothetical protein [Mariniradius sediminis]
MISYTISETTSKRQVYHWLQASLRLAQIENLASGYAWHGLDEKVSRLIKEGLSQSLEGLVNMAQTLVDNFHRHPVQSSLNDRLFELRNRYVRVEETVHFYTIAINSRTNPTVSALLRACDILCVKSMKSILQDLEHPCPLVLTYVEKGLGASILKSGLRLWDGNTSRVAAIKVTQHNLYRPTAIIHETGHQVAHILDWNAELSEGLKMGLKNFPEDISDTFASWASEIAADAYAFVHTGYAAVAALHDVVSGSPNAILAFHPKDPHPVAFVRVLMNIEMCRQKFGHGPWEELQESFLNQYGAELNSNPNLRFVNQCLDALPSAVRIILDQRYRAFRGKSLSELIDPEKVSPSQLFNLEKSAGPSLYHSHAWIWQESIRILALGGLKIGMAQGDLQSLYKQQEEWMIRLGYTGNLN